MTNEAVKIESESEHWMNSKWRPAMGWMYMVVCGFDFVIAPILWSLLQSYSQGSVQTQWQPLTLQGAGLFHIAMGAVLGIAAYGRTQEKLGGANNGGIQMPSSVGTTYVPPPATPTGGTTNGGFNVQTSSPAASGATATGGVSGSNSATATGFSSNTGFGAPAAESTTVVTGFGGKPAPVQPQQPML